MFWLVIISSWPWLKCVIISSWPWFKCIWIKLVYIIRPCHFFISKSLTTYWHSVYNQSCCGGINMWFSSCILSGFTKGMHCNMLILNNGRWGLYWLFQWHTNKEIKVLTLVSVYNKTATYLRHRIWYCFDNYFTYFVPVFKYCYSDSRNLWTVMRAGGLAP
jgi:hypothetical protein